MQKQDHWQQCELSFVPYLSGNFRDLHALIEYVCLNNFHTKGRLTFMETNFEGNFTCTFNEKRSIILLCILLILILVLHHMLCDWPEQL